MSLKKLPELRSPASPGGVRFELSPRALDQWNPSLQAAADSDEASISVLDVIGYDYWTGEGVTSKRVAGALRSIGADTPVTVNINSPGGDMFEGVTIYNMLREHRGRVTVKVLGMAASAASIIAMAGDEIQIGRPSFLMVHNGWIVAAGNRHEFRELADWMEPFDAAMADVYSARSGKSVAEVQKLMDKETWIGGTAAIDQGFADSLLDSDQVKESGAKTNAAAVRRIESALRASGLPKSEAVRLISEFKSSLGNQAGSGEGDPAGRSTGDPAASLEAAALLQTLMNSLKKD